MLPYMDRTGNKSECELLILTDCTHMIGKITSKPNFPAILIFHIV